MIVVGFSSWRALRDTTTTAKAGTTEDTEGHGVFGAESAKGRDTQQKLEPRRTRRGTGFLVQRALRVETHGKSWNHGGHGGARGEARLFTARALRTAEGWNHGGHGGHGGKVRL